MRIAGLLYAGSPTPLNQYFTHWVPVPGAHSLGIPICNAITNPGPIPLGSKFPAPPIIVLSSHHFFCVQQPRAGKNKQHTAKHLHIVYMPDDYQAPQCQTPEKPVQITQYPQTDNLSTSHAQRQDNTSPQRCRTPLQLSKRLTLSLSSTAARRSSLQPKYL